MTTEHVAAGTKAAITPYGNMMGIVNGENQANGLTADLSRLGIADVRLLRGEGGRRFLNREEDTVSGFVLGDEEPKMVETYLAAVEQGKTVFVASIAPEQADQVAAICKAHGATQIVHFGAWVVTNY